MAPPAKEAKSVTADPIEIYRHGFFSARSRAARPIWDREHDPLIYVADPSGSWQRASIR
jgi:hypothetical protein